MKTTVENRQTFRERLVGNFSEEDIRFIEYAYDISKEAHRTHSRDSGERYFEHPRAGALIILDELGLYDRDLLISFLLHDTGEDSPIFGNRNVSYEEFRETFLFRVSKTFGERVAYITLRLTKPEVDGKMFHSKPEVREFYLCELIKDEDVVIGKMVDRLHNLRTLSGCAKGKIVHQIQETEYLYLPIFSTVKGEKKKYADILLSKIFAELQKLKASL